MRCTSDHTRRTQTVILQMNDRVSLMCVPANKIIQALLIILVSLGQAYSRCQIANSTERYEGLHKINDLIELQSNSSLFNIRQADNKYNDLICRHFKFVF